MAHFAIQRAIKYGLKRIDYINPANKLVAKYAPPGYRKGLFKLVKASEIFIGGKSAYDIYKFLTQTDEITPGNNGFPTIIKRPKAQTYQQNKTRYRQPRCAPAKYQRYRKSGYR